MPSSIIPILLLEKTKSVSMILPKEMPTHINLNNYDFYIRFLNLFRINFRGTYLLLSSHLNFIFPPLFVLVTFLISFDSINLRYYLISFILLIIYEDKSIDLII